MPRHRGPSRLVPVAIAAAAFAAATIGGPAPVSASGGPPADLLDVVPVGTGAAPLTNAATATFVVPLLSSGSTGTPIALPTADAGIQHAFGISGSATSEGALALSADGDYLTLAGYGAPPGTTGPTGGTINGTTSSVVPRVVARVDGVGNVDTSTALSDAFSTSNVRGRHERRPALLGHRRRRLDHDRHAQERLGRLRGQPWRDDLDRPDQLAQAGARACHRRRQPLHEHEQVARPRRLPGRQRPADDERSERREHLERGRPLRLRAARPRPVRARPGHALRRRRHGRRDLQVLARRRRLDRRGRRTWPGARQPRRQSGGRRRQALRDDERRPLRARLYGHGGRRRADLGRLVRDDRERAAEHRLPRDRVRPGRPGAAAAPDARADRDARRQRARRDNRRPGEPDARRDRRRRRVHRRPAHGHGDLLGPGGRAGRQHRDRRQRRDAHALARPGRRRPRDDHRDGQNA